MMNHTVRCAAGVALLLVALSGCRQTEGTVPRPVGQQDNKVGDISRDLLAVARGQNGAPQDLRDDLGNLGGVVAPPYLVDELTTALDAALTGREIDGETAGRLSNQLFVALTALDFNDAQIATIRKDVAESLHAAGADPARAERVAAAVEEIQTATTSNVRRWWQRG